MILFRLFCFKQHWCRGSRWLWVWALGLALTLGLGWMLAISTSPAQAAHRQVYVGVYNNPSKIMAAANGQPSGILGDLLQEVARQEGWTLQPVHCTWEACLAALQAGDIDLMPDVAYTNQRANTLDFHQTPALHSWSQIYQREGRVVLQSMLDLQGKRLAVLGGSVQEDFLRTLFSRFGVVVQIIKTESSEQSFAKVANGEADAAAVNYHFGDHVAHRFKLQATSLVFQPIKLYYVASKGHNADLLAAIDRHLNTWQSQPDSFYFQNLQRWNEQSLSYSIPVAFWWGLAGVASLLLLALSGVWWLRREVVRQTFNLRASEEKLSTILNSVDAHIFIKDSQLRYQYANRKLCDFFGLSSDDIIGKTDDHFFDANSIAHILEMDQLVLKTGQRIVEEECCQLIDKTKKHIFLSVKLPLGVPGQTEYSLCGIATEITEQRQFIEEIHQLAFYDPLTHLPNRKQLIEQLSGKP